MSHSTSSEQSLELDSFRFGSKFAHAFIGSKWENLKIFRPLDPLLLILDGYFNNSARKKCFKKKNVKIVISEACDAQKIPKNI